MYHKIGLCIVTIECVFSFIDCQNANCNVYITNHAMNHRQDNSVNACMLLI